MSGNWPQIPRVCHVQASSGVALGAIAALLCAAIQSAGAASFDCARAATAVERMICGESLLERLDERMAELFQRAREAPSANRQALLDAQRAWLATRNACRSTACLALAYRARIKALGGGPAGNAGEPTRELVDGGNALRLADKRSDLDSETIFPLLTGDDAAIPACNASIEQAFREPLTAFGRAYAEFLDGNDGIHIGPPWAFSLGYDRVYVTHTLIAVDGGGYMYTGGAHGGALYLPLVLDRRTGERVEPEALFRPDRDWLTPLAEQARRALREEAPFSTDPDLADDDWFQEGTAPRADNYGLLLPTGDGIRVTFGQYQVGPYAIGDFRVTLPYAALRQLLSPRLFPEQAAAPAGSR